MPSEEKYRIEFRMGDARFRPLYERLAAQAEALGEASVNEYARKLLAGLLMDEDRLELLREVRELRHQHLLHQQQIRLLLEAIYRNLLRVDEKALGALIQKYFPKDVVPPEP